MSGKMLRVTHLHSALVKSIVPHVVTVTKQDPRKPPLHKNFPSSVHPACILLCSAVGL